MIKAIKFLAVFLITTLFTQLYAQPIQLYEQFYGKYDYIAIGNTLNSQENGAFPTCTILSQSSASLNLAPGQEIEAAYLYWAGSGTGDFNIKLNGQDITAERTFSVFMDPTLPAFGAFANVTDIVQATGNAMYTVSDLNLQSAIPPYCNRGLNFGGWSIIIIYEDQSFINNLVNVYDGFTYVSGDNPNVNIVLNGINVIDPQGGKLGFLAWEGDRSISVTETVSLNGILLSNPPLNPANNVFNGTNSFTGADNLYNMDLDVFDISQYVNPGDSTLNIHLTSGQDGVIINNLVVVLSSELPDATIALNPNVFGENPCGNRNLEVTYTVSNIEGTDVLPANIPISFYADQTHVATVYTNQALAIGANLTDTASITIPPGVPDDFTLTVVVDDNGFGVGIQQEVSEENNTASLSVSLLPALDTAEFTNLEACSNTGTYTFDLSQALVSVNPDYQVSYYASHAAASNLNSGMPITTQYTTATTIVYARVYDAQTNCYAVYEIQLHVDQRPTLPTLENLSQCVSNNSGTATFDLTANANLLNADTAHISYYVSLADLEAELNPIANPSAFVNTVNNQTIYVRVQHTPTCYSVGSFTLQVYENPQVNLPSNLVVCDTDYDGLATFNIAGQSAEITSTASAQISYHTSYSDAQQGLNPIENISNYQSASSTIYAFVGNEFCHEIVSFDLVVNSLPQINQPTVYEICTDDIASATFDLTTKSVEMGLGGGNQFSYFESLVDAQNNTNPIVTTQEYVSMASPQTIWVRVSNASGCFIISQFDLILSSAPQIFTPNDLIVCDANNDGYAAFDLTSLIDEVTGGAPEVVVNFYETQNDMIHNANVIQNPQLYFNLAPFEQTIYISVNSLGGSCRLFTSVKLIVSLKPEINKNLDPIALCDDNTDGLATFDLTQAVAQVLGNLDPALHTVEFYSSEADARDANNPIANPTNYVNTLAGQDQVWIRVSHIDSGCFDVVALDLIVHPLPNVAQPNVPAYHLCDSDEDGFEVFDLESYIDIITQGQSGLAVSYHITYEEALSGTNAITNLQFTNQAQYVQTIFVRVETENGCSVVTLLDLVTDPLPVLATPEPIVVCDPDADGFGNVDLSLALDQLLNGANPADYQITFHETYTDAEYGQAAIDPITSYFNIDPFTQVIYVRVATTAESGCTNIYPLTIVVEPAPILPTGPDNTLPALEICDTNTDGFAYFDLTQQTTYILDNTVSNTTNLVVTYHLTQADAEQGVMAITNVTNYLNLSNPQTLWVRLASSVTECFDVASFELIVNVPLTLPTSIQPITICDTDRDGINVYDLTVRIPAILANATNPANYTVDFFPSYAEALAGENQIQNPEAYTSDLHVRSIGVRVTDNTTGCVSYWFFDIRRAPMPNVPPTPTQPLTVCDVTPGANGQDDFIESFDLTVYEEFLRQGDTYLILTYHTSEQDAIDGVNAIADPTDFVSGDTTIYVRVANQPNMGVSCFEIVSFDIVVEPLPLVADNSFEVCEVGSTGFAEFNFLEFNPQLLGPTQELSDFTISYHPTQADAEANTNAISQTTPYQNTSQYAESIWVRIVNIETTCTRVAEITLFAEEGATATQPAQGMFVCDEFDGANDGFTSFDLTAVEAEVLNGQDPAQFAVSYHTTEADANVNANPITTPEDFINTIQGGQTIYIRVENTATNAPCYAVTTLEIVAEQLAEPVITASAPTLCVDWGNTLANDPVILDSGITATGYTFEWYHNGTLVEDENQATLTLTEIGQEGTYEVIAISQNGCISEISESFQVLLSGKASLVSVMTSNAFQGNQNIIVTVEGNGVYAFQLDNGPIQDNGFFADVAPGTHTVTVYDIVTGDINQTYSCATLVISDIQLVDYMKFFTPNGDGYNDYWKITGLNEDHNAEIYIFDRYGKLLKQLNPLGEGWDGTFNGKPLPSTDYWFKVIYNETDLENNIARKEFRAHFSLKR